MLMEMQPRNFCAMCGTTDGDSQMVDDIQLDSLLTPVKVTPRQQKIVNSSEDDAREGIEEDATEQKKSQQKACDLSFPEMASDITDISDTSNNNNNNNNIGTIISTSKVDNFLYSNKSNHQSCERLSILDSSDDENDELLFTPNGVEPNYSSSTTAAQKRQGVGGTAAQEFSFNRDNNNKNDNDDDDDLQLCIDSVIAPLKLKVFPSQTTTTTTTTTMMTTNAPPLQVEISDIESSNTLVDEENFVFENKAQTPRKVWMFRLAFLSIVFLVVLLSLLLVKK